MPITLWDCQSASPATIGEMPKRKNPAAVALGRLGGKAAAGAGVRARYAAMTAEERSELARKAARARWGKTKARSR